MRTILLAAALALTALIPPIGAEAQTLQEGDEACAAGEIAACRWAVENSRRKNLDVYRSALINGCAMGERMFCGEGHVYFANRANPDYEPQTAGVLARTGCENGFEDLCYRAGTFYNLNLGGTPPELARQYALPALTIACAAKPNGKFLTIKQIQNACIILRNDYYDLDAPVTSETQQTLMNGCNAGLAYMCSSAAQYFMKGSGDVQAELESAKTYYERACDLDDYMSCAYRGAIAYFNEQDATKALSFAGPACMRIEKRLEGYACELASTLSYYAEPPSGLSKEGILSKACNMNLFEGCEGMATLAQQSQVPAKMRDYGGKACQLGSDWGCTVVENAGKIERNAANAEAFREMREQADREWKARMAASNAQYNQRSQTLATATHEYWSNWKPSYCEDYTKAGFTSKIECEG